LNDLCPLRELDADVAFPTSSGQFCINNLAHFATIPPSREILIQQNHPIQTKKSAFIEQDLLECMELYRLLFGQILSSNTTPCGLHMRTAL
jgi:hypothetical protein